MKKATGGGASALGVQDLCQSVSQPSSASESRGYASTAWRSPETSGHAPAVSVCTSPDEPSFGTNQDASDDRLKDEFGDVCSTRQGIAKILASDYIGSDDYNSSSYSTHCAIVATIDGSSIGSVCASGAASNNVSVSDGASDDGSSIGGEIPGDESNDCVSHAGQRLADILRLEDDDDGDTGFMRQVSECRSDCSDTSIISDCSAEPSPRGSVNSDFEDRWNRWNDRRKEKMRLKKQRRRIGLCGEVLSGSKAKSLFMSQSECCTIEGMLGEKGLSIRLLKVLGAGTFAKVYKGVWEKECPTCAAGSFVAVKIINTRKGDVGPDGTIVPPKCLKREAEISKQDHPNLIRMLDVSIETVPYAIVLEYCAGGALHHVVSGDVNITLERFGWPQRMKAALDIASGMAHLHTQQIVHRDLKSMNILLLHQVLTVHDAVHAKVADFGLARYISNDDNKYMTEKIGSWYFMAPELFTHKAIYNTKVDVYSYAIVIYEMLSGTFEFGQKLANPQQLVTFSANGGRPAEEAIPETAPAVLQLLMRQSWDVEPSKRPDFSQIVTQLRLGYASMRLDSEFDEAQLLLLIEA